MNHREETKAVKTALKAAGIAAVVSHDRGTAYGWLKINVGSSDQFTHPRESWCDCEQCQTAQERITAIARRAEQIARETTGRHGEYGGEIIVLTQTHWKAGANCSVEIVQP